MGITQPLVRDGSTVSQLVEAAAKITGNANVGQITDLTIAFSAILQQGANPAPKPRQATWLTAFRSHDVNVDVTRILTAECDPSSVRRKLWIRSLPLKTGQTFRTSSGTGIPFNVSSLYSSPAFARYPTASVMLSCCFQVPVFPNA